MSLILGIDPGSRILGYGVIEENGNNTRHIAHGVIDVSDKSKFSQRISLIGDGLSKIIERYQPKAIVLEKVFLGKNVDSAFKLGHARGVCIYEASRRNIPIFEYEARVVKKGITGSGAATKEQVRLIVLAWLKITSDQALDATDALSIAIHHSRMQDALAQFKRMQIDPPADLGESL